MSVTRVEGTRPLEAASTIAQHQPRPAEDPAKTHGADRAAPAPDEEKPKPESNFKPYSLSFRYDEELQRVVVKVIDPTTGELLREIPPESVIEALKQLRKAPGSLVDEEA
jgi:flagellar protein FlaG